MWWSLRVRLGSFTISANDLRTQDLHPFLMKLTEDSKMSGVRLPREDRRNVDRKYFPLNLGRKKPEIQNTDNH